MCSIFCEAKYLSDINIKMCEELFPKYFVSQFVDATVRHILLNCAKSIIDVLDSN